MSVWRNRVVLGLLWCWQLTCSSTTALLTRNSNMSSYTSTSEEGPRKRVHSVLLNMTFAWNPWILSFPNWQLTPNKRYNCLDFLTRKRILDFQIKVLDSIWVQVLQEVCNRFNVQEIFVGETPMWENEEEFRGSWMSAQTTVQMWSLWGSEGRKEVRPQAVMHF